MLHITVLVIALALVYAVKVVAVMRTHDAIVENSTSFSWMRARSYDEVVASAHATEAELSQLGSDRERVSAPQAIRRAGRVGA